jgi:hypothetical protein
MCSVGRAVQHQRRGAAGAAACACSTILP